MSMNRGASSAGAEKAVKIGPTSPIYLIFIKQSKGKGREKEVGFDITCKAREEILPAKITTQTKWRGHKAAGNFQATFRSREASCAGSE